MALEPAGRHEIAGLDGAVDEEGQPRREVLEDGLL